METFPHQIERYLHQKWDTRQDFCVTEKTPTILQKVGLDDLCVTYSPKHLRNAMKPKNSWNHMHGLSVEQIKNLPNLLKHPVAILDSTKRNSILVILDTFDTDHMPVICSIKFMAESKTFVVENESVHHITSVYGRDSFEDFVKINIENNKFLYIDKKKSHGQFGILQKLYPQDQESLDSDISIRPSKNIVKSQFIVWAKEDHAPILDMGDEYVDAAVSYICNEISEHGLQTSFKDLMAQAYELSMDDYGREYGR